MYQCYNLHTMSMAYQIKKETTSFSKGLKLHRATQQRRHSWAMTLMMWGIRKCGNVFKWPFHKRERERDREKIYRIQSNYPCFNPLQWMNSCSQLDNYNCHTPISCCNVTDLVTSKNFCLISREGESGLGYCVCVCGYCGYMFVNERPKDDLNIALQLNIVLL